jgi:hypothetical protein
LGCRSDPRPGPRLGRTRRRTVASDRPSTPGCSPRFTDAVCAAPTLAGVGSGLLPYSPSGARRIGHRAGPCSGPWRILLSSGRWRTRRTLLRRRPDETRPGQFIRAFACDRLLADLAHYAVSGILACALGPRRTRNGSPPIVAIGAGRYGGGRNKSPLGTSPTQPVRPGEDRVLG